MAALVITAASAAGTAVVGADVPATAMDLRAGAATNSPMLAADPSDPTFVVLANRVDAPDFSCALQLSGDGGADWVPAQPVPRLPAGAEKCYAPNVAFDSSGRLYYLFVGLHGNGNNPMGVFLTTSTDRGRNFTMPRAVLGPDNYQVRMAIDRDGNRLHLVWLHTSAYAPTGGLPLPPNPILAAYSDDQGRTFSAPVQVSDPSHPYSVAPAIVVAPAHTIHVVYYDLGSDVRDYRGLEGPAWEGLWSLVSVTSHDGGRSFDRGTVVDDQLVPPERVMLIYTMPPPSIATDAAGRVFIAWDDARNGDSDVFLRRSVDGGRSWSPPLRLNDDPLHDGRSQYLPRVSVAPNGRVDAIFYDRRNDPANTHNDVYYTYSTDAGVHFAANLRLTTMSSSIFVGQRYLVTSAKGLVEFGSRLGLLSRDDAAVAAWTDTRESINEGTAQSGPTAQDILTTTVTFPGSPTRSVGWMVAAAVGMLAAVAAAAIVVRRRRGQRRRKLGEQPSGVPSAGASEL